MRLLIKISLLLLLPVLVNAQKPHELDSLHFALKNAANDTIRMVINESLGWYYQQINRDSTLFYGGLELQLARQLNQRIDEASALRYGGMPLCIWRTILRRLNHICSH